MTSVHFSWDDGFKKPKRIILVAQLVKHDLAYKLLDKIPNWTKQNNFEQKTKFEINLGINKKLFVIFFANLRSYKILKIMKIIFFSCKQSFKPAPLAILVHGDIFLHS